MTVDAVFLTIECCHSFISRCHVSDGTTLVIEYVITCPSSTQGFNQMSHPRTINKGRVIPTNRASLGGVEFCVIGYIVRSPLNNIPSWLAGMARSERLLTSVYRCRFGVETGGSYMLRAKQLLGKFLPLLSSLNLVTRMRPYTPFLMPCDRILIE